MERAKFMSEIKNRIIDDLLIELSDINDLIKLFGIHRNDEKQDRIYLIRKNRILARLSVYTGTGEINNDKRNN